jgi:hypothetical protein
VRSRTAAPGTVVCRNPWIQVLTSKSTDSTLRATVVLRRSVEGVDAVPSAASDLELRFT